MTYPPDRRTLRRAMEGLALFQDVLDDPIGKAVRAIAVEPSYVPAARLVALLAEEAELYPEEMVGDAWQNHLLDRILASENAFSAKAERGPIETMGEGLRRQVRRELGVLQQLYGQGGTVLAAEAHAALGDDSGARWDAYRPLARGPGVRRPEATAIKRALAASTNWPALLEQLGAAYAALGVGDFGRYLAFRWVPDRNGGRLQGVPRPDPVRLEDLFAYDRERGPAVRNAERFASGFPANNVLLYGERGTGKSSTVKALLNAFADKGLRLIEVAKEDLADFPGITALLRDHGQRFLLFVDDLSFEEHETYFKALKAALEGDIEVRPDNVVVYATSNRRHVVKEHFTDRERAGEGEVHPFETWEEKLSLADRFGIRVLFGAPDQDRYLAIVEGLAERRAIALPREELRRRALTWAQRENGRSGRTARQFIDHLVGELALP